MRLTAFLRDNAPWLSAGVLLTFLSGFGQTYFISVFAGEIRSEFGLSHGEWGGIYSLGTTVSAIVSGTAQAVALSPTLKVIASSGAAVTFKASHVVNLSFHRDAFAFANRGLLQSENWLRNAGVSKCDGNY